jgi:hypothetical protein
MQQAKLHILNGPQLHFLRHGIKIINKLGFRAWILGFRERICDLNKKLETRKLISNSSVKILTVIVM